MRWMMYRWWCEGERDRAWWVIERVFLRSPNKGFWACLGDLLPYMPRRPETWVSLCNLMLKLCGSAILWSDSPQSSNRKGNSIHPPWETWCQTLYWRLFKATTAYTSACTDARAALALMRELNWHRSWAEEPGYATGNPPEDYGQIRGGFSFPWMTAVD